MFPGAARRCAGWIAVLAIIGILYGALVAMVQPNMKKLVAYSSVSHLGFVVLGIFSFTRTGLDGAVFQMLAHGISTGALFALVGILYERRHSLEIADYGGVATPAPWLSTVFLITTFASAGLPLLSNFVGEFLVLQGSAQANFRWTVFAAIGVILAACYLLWLYQRVFYGETPEDLRSHMPDLSAREWSAMIPLVVMMVWLGVGSQTFLPRIGVATESILKKTTENVPFQVKLTTEPEVQSVAILSQGDSWRRHSCLPRRDSSRRSALRALISGFGASSGVETSLDAADTSVCATVASGDFADGNKELASVR
jgi:NADH-quinone oxidoreductase subunit M